MPWEKVDIEQWATGTDSPASRQRVTLAQPPMQHIGHVFLIGVRNLNE